MQSAAEVLARKYRPTNFEELIGQESVAQTLSLALDSNRLSHAYLFSGLRGSGKTSTARIFAKALLCERGISHKPCEVCENCVMAKEGRHMDIIEMDAASSRKIDDIRDLIEQTKYKPAVGRFKIFIIDEVHMLTKEAFNALLKTLEEPPEFVKFILATTDPLKLPATILSRTQHFRFKRIATNKITAHLRHILELENIGYDTEALEILARSGNGSLRDTLTLLDQAIIYSKGHVDVATVTDMLGLVDPKFIADLFSAIFAKDTTRVLEFAKILEEYEAEMVVDELIAYLKDRLIDGDGAFSPLVIERFFRILSDSKYLFSINADGGFVLNLVFFKMIEALKIKEIDTLIAEFEKGVGEMATRTLEEKPLQAKSEPLSKDMATQEQPKQPQPKEALSQPMQETKMDVPSSVIEEANEKGKALYVQLLGKIKDRSYELWECFEKQIEYKSFDEGVLSWESCVDEACKERLKHGFSVIKMLVKDVFGFETKIKKLDCTKEMTRERAKETSVKNDEATQERSMPPQQPPQSATTIEEAEAINASSCVASCNGLDEPKAEVNDIMQEEMVQKALELFEAKRVVIQSKV